MSEKIDDTLSGITPSSTVIPMGRPESEDRPGEALVEMVADYRAAGGFRKNPDAGEPDVRAEPSLPEVNGLVSRYTTDPEEVDLDLKD